MIELTAIGWIHTIVGMIAIGFGVLQIITLGEVRADTRTGQIFLILTALTSITALLLHVRTTFGPGHILAVLALGAIGFGLVVGRGAARGSWRHILAALAYSFTLVCQLIPGASEALTRLPLGNPVVASFDAPELKLVFLGILAGFAILALYQTVRLRRQLA